MERHTKKRNPLIVYCQGMDQVYDIKWEKRTKTKMEKEKIFLPLVK